MEALNSLKSVVKENNCNSLHGLVIDLQSNPGGSLSGALDLAAMFLSHGLPLLQWKSAKETKIFRSINRQPDITTPILILMDRFTASGSEVFAAALSDHKRAILAGNRSFGKNSAQVFDFQF